jgi:hypothetical protein
MSTEQTANRSGPELKGIGGWLLFLCIYLFLFEPLRAVLGLLALSQSAGGSAAMQNVLVFGAVLQTAIGAFSLFTAFMLIRLRPAALSLAKIYFVIMLTLGVLGLGMVGLAMVGPFSDPSIGAAVRGPAIFTAVTQILISGAWLVYLEQSRRVRATFAAG